MKQTKTISSNAGKATMDLTQGPILPLMLRFCLPILLGNIMQQLYNMVDAAIVGKFVGTSALAAVGATGSITFLIIGFVDGMCAGFAIPIARSFGAGDAKLLRKCIVNMIYLGVFFAVVLTVGTSAALRWLLTVMDFPADIFEDSLIYLRVIFIGIPATIFYNSQAGMLRALGNSRTPLLVLMMASVVNITLDLIFVCVLKMGVFGVAIATTVSQAIAGIACFIYIIKKYPELHWTRDEAKFVPEISWRLFMSGIPMALQYSITAIGSVLIQVAVNNLGSNVVASVTAANKVQSFVHLPFSTLGVTLSTWCGQNMGARDYGRIRKGVNTGLAMAMIYSAAMGVMMFFCGEYISLIFLDKDEPMLETLLSYIRQFIRSNCILYIPLGILTVYRFSLQGLEYGVTAMFAGLFEMAARSVVALYFAKTYGFGAICFANPAAWIAACVLLVPAYFIIIPRVKKKLT